MARNRGALRRVNNSEWVFLLSLNSNLCWQQIQCWFFCQTWLVTAERRRPFVLMQNIADRTKKKKKRKKDKGALGFVVDAINVTFWACGLNRQAGSDASIRQFYISHCFHVGRVLIRPSRVSDVVNTKQKFSCASDLAFLLTPTLTRNPSESGGKPFCYVWELAFQL